MTIQNWSDNVYNLVTKRAVAYEGATTSTITSKSISKPVTPQRSQSARASAAP